MAATCAEDIEELQALLAQAKRPRVQKLLSDELSNLKKIDEQTKPSIATQKPVLLERTSATPHITYSTIPSFSWDQDDERVKIYLSLEGASSEKLNADFGPQSFDLKIHDVSGKNYRYAIPKLSKHIDANQSKVIVKPKRIIVSLKKKDWGNWFDLQYKESTFKPKVGDDNKDPMGGIMDLMKNMYDEGDEDMKRTIAKAWSDARSGKKANPMSDFQSDI